MEIFTLTEDMEIFCLEAASFPHGVLEAHQKLHGLFEGKPNRNCFGISHPVQGRIIYKAAAEELEKGELSRHGLESFTIKRGDYLYLDLPDFTRDISAIGRAFQQILQEENIDPDGCCIEWYLPEWNLPSELCRCMVKTK